MRRQHVTALLAMLSVVTVTILGCAIPGKDNPFDPANAPVGALRIVDRTAPDGTSCLTAGSTLVSVATRARCLYLDASGSGPNPGALLYTFSVSTQLAAAPTDDSAFLTLATDQPSPFLALGTTGLDILRGLPVESAITFRVVAQKNEPDRAHRAPATASLVLLNAAPVAVADPSRVVPLGGFPWAAPYGMPTVLRFHGGRSFDPDLDPIVQYRWTFTSTTSATPGQVFGPFFQKDVDWTIPTSVAGRIEATLVVSDGKVDSLPTRTSVIVGDRVPWAGNAADGLFAHVDSRADLPSPVSGGFQKAAFFPDSTGGSVALVFDQSSEVDLLGGRWPDLSSATVPITAWLRPMGAVAGIEAIQADPSRGRLWVIERDYNPVPHLFDFNGTSIVPHSGFVPAPIQVPDAAIQTVPTAVGDDGSLWYAHLPGHTAWRVNDTGASAPGAISTSGTFVAALSVRPGTPAEVWGLEVPDALSTTSGATALSARIAVYDPQPGAAFTLGHSQAFGFAWIDHDQFWIDVEDLGLLRVDANLLEAGLSLDQATVERIPGLGTEEAAFITVDPVTGDAWTTGFDRIRAHRVTTSGLDFQYLIQGETDVQFIDPLGTPWIWSYDAGFNGALRAGRDLGFDMIANHLDASVVQNGFSADLATGSLWLASPVPPSIGVLGPDGDVATRFTRDSNGAGLPPALYLRVSPDGGTAWGFPMLITTAGIALLAPVRYDVHDQSLDSHSVFNASLLPDLQGVSGYDGFVFEPSAPIPASTPFVWMVRQSVGGAEAAPADGSTPVNRFAIPSDEITGTRVTARASARSNDLCLVSHQHTPDDLLVRLIPVSGNVGAPLLALANPITGTPGAVVADASDATGDRWWVVFTGAANTDPFYVYLLEPGANPIVHSYTDATGGKVLSAFGLSADQLWLTVDRPGTFNAQTTLVRLRFTPGVGGVLKDEVAAPIHRESTFPDLVVGMP